MPGAENGEEDMGAAWGDVPGESPLDREMRAEEDARGGEPIGPKSMGFGELRSEGAFRRGVLTGRGGGDFSPSSASSDSFVVSV